MTANANIVSGRPSKAFFIDMITRDLTVEDAILDLIDNAIDEAVERQNVNVMATLTEGSNIAPRFTESRVDISTLNGSLVVKDTCGGISIEQARHTVFRFGNPGNRHARGGLSVYGIGMKRAFFKIGKAISVESLTATERFRVDIDVEEWRSRGDDEWDFAFTSTATHSKPPQTPGTRIVIGDLTMEAKVRIRAPSFRKDLLARLSSTYALFLDAGFQIAVDGQLAESALPDVSVVEGQMRSAWKRFQHGGVDILLIAGISPRTDKRRHGWYVFCNGRIVLDADQTEDTGWGTRLPKWHTKFGHFVGMVYFHSQDVRLLPWRTTKQGVVVESDVYQKALAEMQLQARPVLNFLTDLYPGDVEEEGPAERELLNQAKAVAVKSITRSETPFVADLSAQRAHAKIRPVNIQFKKPQGEIDRLRECVRVLRRASAKRVGEYAFDYLLKQECPDK